MWNSDNLKKVFGSNVRKYRKMHSITQEQLAEKIAITPKHLGSIEKGYNFVSSDVLQALSEVLKVPVKAFFVDADDNTDSHVNAIKHIVQDEFAKAILEIENKVKEL